MEVTKEEAIRLVRDLAARNGGKVSFSSFIEEAGIPKNRLRRALWFPGWNNFLQEIGLTTNQFLTDRISDGDIAVAVAELIKRLKRWPTEDEFAREKKANPTIPDVSIIRRAKTSGKLRSLLEHYRPDDETATIVRTVAAHLPAVDEDETSDGDKSLRVQGFVYMLRSGRRYKIGFTNSPVRRFREVRIELPDETIQVHTIETDDPRGIEDYWHRRFASKRIRNSEWFELDVNDIRAFKRRKYQ
jgi:Meiotically up-regulated gene 113